MDPCAECLSEGRKTSFVYFDRKKYNILCLSNCTNTVANAPVRLAKICTVIFMALCFCRYVNYFCEFSCFCDIKLSKKCSLLSKL